MRMERNFSALLLAAGVAALPLHSHAGVFVSVTIAPPALPVYAQPVCPGPDALWTPGFWQWDPAVADYYWIPGTWVVAPQPGFLWTPGYWGFGGGAYLWHAGYWGPHIGFYGGVNYGFGYGGVGFSGGYWNGGHFFYNTAVSHVNVNVIHNTYIHNTTIINHVNNTHVSYNGGPGGVAARPTVGEQAALRENHFQPTAMQTSHADFARQDRSQFASVNHGAPAAAALARPAANGSAFRANAVAASAPGGPFRANAGAFRNGNQTGQPQRGFANSEPNGQNGFRPQQASPYQPQNRPVPQATENRGNFENRPQQSHAAPPPRPEQHGGEDRGRR